MKRNIYISLLLLFLLTGCFGSDDRLTLENRTNRLFFFEFTLDSDVSSVEDKLKWVYTKEIYNKQFNAFNKRLQPYDFQKLKLIGKNGWLKKINKSKTKTIYFFFFQDSIVSKYGSKYVIQHNLCEKESYTLEELEKSNWVVTYPKE